MIEITFQFPKELDLAFEYLNYQFKRFQEEAIALPQHEIAIGDEEISILMWYEDDEDSGEGGSDDDDPIWPLPPELPSPISMTEIVPDWIQTWT